MITPAQAKVFRKLYARTVNQNHVQEWAQSTLRHDQASPVIAKIKVLSKVFWEENPNEFKEIQLWGRMKIRELGYKEEEQPKSL